MADLAGLLVVDKPVGPTSMQAVATIRARAGRRKTGHAGTLDPLASGVLLVAVGRATKSIERLMATDKCYRTTIDLAITTVGHDLETEPEPVEVPDVPDLARVESALEAFRGSYLQRPPDRSAVKVGGRRAYALARSGAAMKVEPRPVLVHAMELVRYVWPIVEIELRCAKGFYVRSLARDLGAELGAGGVCRMIRRTAVGPFTLEEATALESVPDPLEPRHLIPIDQALGRISPA